MSNAWLAGRVGVRFSRSDITVLGNVERASSITSIKVCASSPWRQRIVSLSSSPEEIASIREGSSCRANARLIRRSQAGALELRKKG